MEADEKRKDEASESGDDDEDDCSWQEEIQCHRYETLLLFYSNANFFNTVQYIFSKFS